MDEGETLGFTGSIYNSSHDGWEFRTVHGNQGLQCFEAKKGGKSLELVRQPRGWVMYKRQLEDLKKAEAEALKNLHHDLTRSLKAALKNHPLENAGGDLHARIMDCVYRCNDQLLKYLKAGGSTQKKVPDFVK